MDKNTYVVVNRFNCCGRPMVTVIIKEKSASVMPELEYNRIIETERKFMKNNQLKKTASNKRIILRGKIWKNYM